MERQWSLKVTCVALYMVEVIWELGDFLINNNNQIFTQDNPVSIKKCYQMGSCWLRITAFPAKPWTPEKISGMFIVLGPIRCEMKPQKITDKPQQGSLSHYFIWNNELAFSSTRNLQFSLLGLSEKAIFWPQTNTSHLIPSVQKPNYKITLKVTANCENL